MSQRKLRYAMVGGGPGAMIGTVHRTVNRIEDRATLESGVFSRDPKVSKEFGKTLGIDEDRLYSSFEEMATQEAKRSEDRIDFAVIVTPNATHYAASKAFLEAGFHVVCDKPLTFEVEESQELLELAQKNNLLFGVSYTYSNYTTVKQIAHLIASGAIGDILYVNGEYISEWLATRAEDSGNKQAAWRTDPALSGKSNSVGDIGVHIENVVATMTNLRIKKVNARLDTLVEGRLLDDNATIMIEYEGGAKGLYWTSQVAIGYGNDLRIRIIGTKGSIEWRQEDPNYFTFATLDQPKQRYSRGREIVDENSEHFNRLGDGHPEGYYEAFANFYRGFIDSVEEALQGKPVKDIKTTYPTVVDGLNGVRFVDACVESSRNNQVWVELK